MGERAFSDRRMHRRIVPESDCKRSSTAWGRGGAPLAPCLIAVLCSVVLASCATTEDGIAARRNREAQKLSEAKVWKSGAAGIEPQVMPAPRTETQAGSPKIATGSASTPERLESSAAPEAPGSAKPKTSDASTSLEAGETAETAALMTEADNAAPGDEQEPGDDARSLLEVPDEELTRELLLRKLKQWENQAGGYSRASNLTPDNEEQQLAREIVTLGFISDGRSFDETGLAEAAMTLSATGDREDLIRAALALQQLGRTSESDDILRRLTEENDDEENSDARVLQIAEEPRSETTATTATTGTVETAETAIVPVVSTPSETATFELVSVTFASRIDGPGDFVTMAAESIQRGKDVLVYGEFAGFRTIEYRAEAGDQPTHSRAFSASLRLQDAESNILEELKFLPPRHGRQFVDDAGEAVNFWARYQIPEDLAAGQYEIVITAEDHFGGQSAKAELGFAVK